MIKKHGVFIFVLTAVLVSNGAIASNIKKNKVNPDVQETNTTQTQSCEWDQNVHESTLDYKTSGKFLIELKGNQIERIFIKENISSDDGENSICTLDTNTPNLLITAKSDENNEGIDFTIIDGASSHVDSVFNLVKYDNQYTLTTDVLDKRFCSNSGGFTKQIVLTKSKTCKLIFR